MPLPKYRFTHYLALIPFAGLLLGQQCAPPANHASVAIPPPTVIPQPQLTLVTSQGTIVIELFHLQAPQTVANVLQYVQDGFYVGTIFHDVSPGNGIAGGSYTADLTVKPTRDPVVNESNNGLRNLRGRVALAEPDGTDSGTSQLLINLADNAQFDFDLETGNRGLTVFGRVIQGMEVVEAIGKLETTQGTASDGASLNSLPVDPPVIQSVETSATLPPPTSQPTTPPPTAEDNRPPVADAGNSRNVAPGITATLDGSASRDPNLGDQISFSWEQTAGTTVALSNAASQRPTFEVPSGDEKLSFTLTVTDLLGESATDTVDLTIVPEPKVRLATTKGDILLEFFSDTPVTTKNFLQYVEDGFYNGTIFHRVVRDFVVQGGGFLPGLAKQSGLRDAIVNEFSAERSNLRETVAMAKLGGDPDSATSQFFFNLGDNSGNLDTQNGGFTVFAKVVEGMDVVDAIAAVPTGTKQDASGNSFGDVPLEDVVITTATIESGTTEPPPPPDETFTTTPSGLQYRDEVVGTGDLVMSDSTLRVLYTGRLTDENGEIFDSSLDPNSPAEFNLGGLIQGWKEGLGEVEMHAGGKRILIIPPELGYGDSEQGSIPANSTLWFEIEVLEVVP